MATEKKSNTLAQIGPIAAPLAGAVIALGLIAAAVLTSSVSDGGDKLTETSAKVQKNLSNPAVGPNPDPIPLADGVVHTFDTKGTNDWKPDAGSRKLLELPVKWEVMMDAPKGDTFSEFDENIDGIIDEIEWPRGPLEKLLPGSQQVFKNWDRDPADAQITRKEWGQPPEDDEEALARLDKNQDGQLKSKDGEITTQQEFDWDSYPFEGTISLDEYKDRFKPKQERGLGVVEDVAAKVDAATMEIVVTWTDPKIDDKPDDISFMILRRAPETVAKRQREYGRKVGEYEKKLREWEGAFDKWWNDATADAEGKTNKQKWAKKADALKEYEKNNPKPVTPEKVSEWETVTEMPVKGNEYRDKTFDMNVTYTYAVYMGTQKKPKREQRVRTGTEAAYPGWFFYADNQVAPGHPVLVRNRVVMAVKGAADEGVTMILSQWYRQEQPATWYRIEITETLKEGDPVGGEYRNSDLTARKVTLRDLAGTEVNPAGILPTDNTIVDFTTGFSFVAKAGGGFMLNSRTLGDFLLPTETKGPVRVPQGTAGSENALEVRCLAVKAGGKDGTFEVTRWHKVGENWFRVVMISMAKKGGDVGGEVALDKPGADVTVYDATGKVVPAAELGANKDLKDVKVDLKAGSFDGLVDRTVTVGGKEFDLFGTLYKD